MKSVALCSVFRHLGTRVGRGGSRVKTLPPARHFPLLLPPDSPDSFVAFPCELEPQNRRKMPRRGRGKKRKGEKKEEKKGLRYLFRLSIEGLYPGRRRGFAGLSRALIKRERGGKEGEKRGKRGRKGEEKRVLILKFFRGLRPRTPLNWGGSAPTNPPALEGASPPLGVYSRQGSASRSRYALP